jgi:hypothetical protein
MTSGRTVEKTVLLALIVKPSPGKRVPSGLRPARYQVTSTPWRARHSINHEIPRIVIQTGHLNTLFSVI